MQIAVIGPGALGTVFGGCLAAAGNDTWLLHRRQSYVDQVAERGVRIEDGSGENEDLTVDVSVTTDAATVGPVDLALVFVKTYQTLPALGEHAACLGRETRVLSLQNGVSNHYRLRDHVGAGRTLSGVTREGGTLAGPGHAVRTFKGTTMLGGSDAAFAERVGEVFTDAGLETEVVDDPFYHIWHKQVFGGAVKPVAALTRNADDEFGTDGPVLDVMDGLIREGAAVAETEGHDIDPDEVSEALRRRLGRSAHKPSMLRDVEAGRKTEIDDCNGAVVEFARDAGIDVPYNEMATALVRSLERGYLD